MFFTSKQEDFVFTSGKVLYFVQRSDRKQQKENIWLGFMAYQPL